MKEGRLFNCDCEFIKEVLNNKFQKSLSKYYEVCFIDSDFIIVLDH